MIKERKLETADINGRLGQGIDIRVVRVEFVRVDQRNGVVEIGVEKADTDISMDKDIVLKLGA